MVCKHFRHGFQHIYGQEDHINDGEEPACTSSVRRHRTNGHNHDNNAPYCDCKPRSVCTAISTVFNTITSSMKLLNGRDDTTRATDCRHGRSASRSARRAYSLIL